MNPAEFFNTLASISLWYLLFTYFSLYLSLLLLSFRVVRIHPRPEALHRFVDALPRVLRLVLSFLAPRSSTLNGYLERLLQQSKIPTLLLLFLGLLCFGSLMFVMLRQLVLGLILSETPSEQLAHVVILLLCAFQVGQALRFGRKLQR